MVYTAPFVACRIFLWCLVVVAAGRARNVTVCPGTVLSIQDLAEYSRKNCTVIEGSFLLRRKPSDSDDTNNDPVANVSITPLSTIVEITGTLTVFQLEKGVDDLGQILPNLAVVRGYPHHRFIELNTSIVIAENKYLKSISLTKLTHVLGDETIPAILWNNKDLDYIHTVKWQWISSSRQKAAFFGFSEEMGLHVCPPSCPGFCWNGRDCQKVFPDNCSAVDFAGNCSCHEECLSSCKGKTDEDCISCKHFYYQGRCVPSCPVGTVKAAGWRCVDQCPYAESNIAWNDERRLHQTFAFNGECVLNCPHNYTGDRHTKTCVHCSNTNSCEIHCPGGYIGSLDDAKRFQGCIHVEGSLTINILTDSNGDGNLTRYLGSVKHVDGYVEIINSPRLKTLEFLDNLTSINANDLVEFSDEFFALVIVNNRNLQSVYWKGQQNLWLGGRTDAQVLIAANYLACQDSILKLKSQLPMITLREFDNSYLAVCNIGHLNLSTQEYSNGTTYLQWDAVPQENQTSFTGCQIMWQIVGTIESAPQELPEEYDENNPESCGNTGWESVTVNKVTSYKLDKKMLKTWKTTAFQVRAEFTQRGIGFKSNLLHVNGFKAVPSCPRIMSRDLKTTSSSVNISWQCPKYYNQSVTSYRIAVNHQDEPLLMENKTSSLSNITLDCSMDTAISQIRPSCIKLTKHVKDVNVTDPLCKGPVCKTTIKGLINYVDYQVEIQATNPGGCGRTSQKINFRTKADHLLDKVSNLSVTVFPGPSLSTENVQVSWKKPQKPNGGYVQYYEVSIEFKLSQKEESNFQHSHNQWVLPPMKDLGCSYTSGPHQSYSCQIRSNETWVALNLTLMRISGRQLSYIVTVRVASALGKPTEKVPTTLTQFTVLEDLSTAPTTSNERSSDSEQAVSTVIVPVVIVSLVLVIIVLVYCTWRQKHKRKRGQIEAMSHLYFNLDGGTGMLVSGEYLPDEWEMNRDEVVLGEELGHGAFGLVYQGTWQNPDGRPLDVAVKTLNNEARREDRLSFLFEASVMKHFNSDHIVRLLGIVSEGTPVMVVMELMRNGDLKGYLRALRPESEEAIKYENFPISEEELLQIAVQIASGMVYLTSKKFVHRDLAARNCMVTGDIQIKIGDFGMTRDVYQSDYYRKKGHGALPVRWMPPESLQDGVFAHSSDIWSFGIVLWEIATLAMQPYPGMSNSDVFEYIVGGGVMDTGGMKHVPSTFLIIMERCWLYRPTDRPTFETILACLPPLDGAATEV